MKRRSASEPARISAGVPLGDGILARRLGRHEQIAEPAHGLDHLDVQLLAQPADEDLDGVGIAVEVLVVEMLDQLGARDHAAGMMHEIGEQAVLVRGELHLPAVDRHAARARVQHHRPAGQFARGMAGGAAQQGADARQHLLHVEGFCDIVVGAGIEALHLVAPAVARGEDEHGHLAPLAPPGLQHREPVHLRQADVQHDGVIGLGLAEEMAFLAIMGAVDGIAGLGQRLDHLAIEIGIVLDNEQAHGNSSTRRRAGSARRGENAIVRRGCQVRRRPRVPRHPHSSRPTALCAFTWRMVGSVSALAHEIGRKAPQAP